jgi:hypothetical protein
MLCKTCGSQNQNNFTAEIAIHFPGLKNIDKPTVFVFPMLNVCLACGAAEFVVRQAELQLLKQTDAAARG